MAITSATVSDSAVLNNYIAQQNAATSSTSSTTASKSSATNSPWGNFDTFLKVLTTQLKNQDPTAPMDPSQFTQQLVQYAGVEQQINTNTKLDSVLGALNSNGITPLLGYVGQYVEAPADGKLVVQGGTAKLAYDLPEEAVSTKIYVKNSAGKTVATIDGVTTKGMTRVVWDGSLDAGGKATDGTYAFSLTAKNKAGDTIKVEDIRVIGQVTGIETGTDGKTTLKVGDLSIKDTDVKSVFAGVTAKASTEDTTEPSS